MSKILVIEDMRSIQLLVQKVLEKAGHSVVMASNGKEGIDRLCIHQNVDLVLLDIMMPDMGGVEFLEQYAELCDRRETKVCMLTSLATDEHIAECIALGAYDYITKPIDIDLFSDKIDMIINNDNSKKFATIRACFDLVIMDADGEIVDGEMHFLSENRAMIATTKEYSEGDMLRFACDDLMQVLKADFDFFGRIILKQKASKSFYYMIDYVGFNEDKTKKLRNITVLGKDIGAVEPQKAS